MKRREPPRAQRKPTRAAVLGAVGSLVALLGYAAMTVSPLEHASFSVITFTAFVRSNLPWFAGALVTGPLFGWLGHRWAVARAPYAIAAPAVALVLEPFAHVIARRSVPFGTVAATEFVIGLALVAHLLRLTVRVHRDQPSA